MSDPTERGAAREASPEKPKIQIRDFDAERVIRELDAQWPSVERALKELDDAKRISPEVWNMRITI